MKYNDLNVPETIRINRIVSAFQNAIDSDKLERYTEIMRVEMLSHSFPAIMGFPSVINEDDLGQYFLSGEEITEDHIGQLCWNVTDGHHRSLAAIEANLPYLETTLDYSCITC